MSNHESEAFEDSHVRRMRLPVRVARAPLSRHPDDGWQLAEPYVLGPTALRALRGLIITLCPSAPAPCSPELFERVELHVRQHMRYMHPLAAWGFCLCLGLLDWAPRLLLVSARRLHALGRQRASRLLSEMVGGRFAFLRTLVVAVRGLVLSAYFDQDEVHAAIGYAPLPFLRERVERRKALLAAPAARVGGVR
jgi:hypothetical protein